jgi:diguanylate cyclase (GGDEF)-like protein
VNQDRQTILIVDDTPINIRMLSELLMDEHDIMFATSGEDGLKRALQERPDLILLDIMMPGMDGYEVCRLLKEDPVTRDIPVIFVSALSQEADEAKGLAVGAIDYITKPISAPIIKARVHNHLKLKRYQDMLASQALLDGLTGIPNRRRFDETLQMEWHRALRTGNELSLLMIDIDHFKRYNDTYGHLAGDDCLTDVARVMAEVAHRGGDLVARYGGEEFGCILPETGCSGARNVAEKIIAAVNGLQIAHADSPVAPTVTVSIGGCTTRPDDHQAYDQLVACADRNLYRAKQAGRNRACFCEDDQDCTLSCKTLEPTS